MRTQGLPFAAALPPFALSRKLSNGKGLDSRFRGNDRGGGNDERGGNDEGAGMADLAGVEMADLAGYNPGDGAVFGSSGFFPGVGRQPGVAGGLAGCAGAEKAV